MLYACDGHVYASERYSQIGYTTEPKDISAWFVRAGVLVALLGVVLSLLWTNRLV